MKSRVNTSKSLAKEIPGLFEYGSGAKFKYDFKIESTEWNIHPESFGLKATKFEGIITIRFGNTALSKDTARGQERRESFLRVFMDRVRAVLDLNGKDFCWVSATEFGSWEAGHCHILISFDPMRRRGKSVPDLETFPERGQKALGLTAVKLGIPERALDFHWRDCWFNDGLVDYACKLETGRAYKHFTFSKKFPFRVNILR